MREYLKDWSRALGRDMEVLRFGSSGLSLLVFPTSQGRFYQWEDFGLVGALWDKVEAGYIQLWCVDSIDAESWYASDKTSSERVARHLDYERYLVEELMPRIPWPPVAVGTSFGAFHALLLALRHPTRLNGFIGLSGAYDASRWLHGDDGYFVNPPAFLPGFTDEAHLAPLRAMEKKVIATGQDDAHVADSLRCAELLKDKGVDVWLDVWPGWAHDWPYWQEMMRRYV